MGRLRFEKYGQFRQCRLLCRGEIIFMSREHNALVLELMSTKICHRGHPGKFLGFPIRGLTLVKMPTHPPPKADAMSVWLLEQKKVTSRWSRLSSVLKPYGLHCRSLQLSEVGAGQTKP